MVWVSATDRGQTVENQLQPFQDAAGRLGGGIVAILIATSASAMPGGRDKRPGPDVLLTGVARRGDRTMTTQHEMEIAYTTQQEVIDTLRSISQVDLAARLERCMTARQQRHYGSGWPYSCRFDIVVAWLV